MPFSFAIFSADWPIVRPVDGSAMAGACGTRSRGRRRAKMPSRAPSERAFCASTRARDMRRLWRIGTSDRLSAPPAMPTSTCPSRMAEITSTIASFADAHARFTVCAGTDRGSGVRSTTSRPRFGAFTDGTTWPITTMPTTAGSISVRSSSSRTAAVPRSSAVMSR